DSYIYVYLLPTRRSSDLFTSDGWFTNERLSAGTGSDHSAYAQQTSAGRYELNGYSIILKFNNGDTKRFFFCYYGQDKDVFRLSRSEEHTSELQSREKIVC